VVKSATPIGQAYILQMDGSILRIFPVFVAEYYL
jgi:hypothetical protein